jgi:hypothetical protein
VNRGPPATPLALAYEALFDQRAQRVQQVVPVDQLATDSLDRGQARPANERRQAAEQPTIALIE